MTPEKPIPDALQAAIDEIEYVIQHTPRARDLRPQYGTSEWERANAIALCLPRGVNIAVYDFIVHNMSRSAAHAALLAMPMIGRGAA